MNDYGIDAEDPESLIMAVLDNGQLGKSVFKALSDCGWVIVRSDLLAALTSRAEIAEAALAEAAQIVVKACPKCGGEGWLWGHELNDPPDVIGHDDTKYSCDGDLHERAEAILARAAELEKADE